MTTIDKLAGLLGIPRDQASAVVGEMTRAGSGPVEELPPAEFASQANRAVARLASGTDADLAPLPDRAAALMTLLDRLTSEALGPGRRRAYETRVTHATAELVAEVGPEVVLIQGGRALVPATHPDDGRVIYGAMRCRDLDLEHWESGERRAILAASAALDGLTGGPILDDLADGVRTTTDATEAESYQVARAIGRLEGVAHPATILEFEAIAGPLLRSIRRAEPEDWARIEAGIDRALDAALDDSPRSAVAARGDSPPCPPSAELVAEANRLRSLPSGTDRALVLALEVGEIDPRSALAELAPAEAETTRRLALLGLRMVHQWVIQADH